MPRTATSDAASKLAGQAIRRARHEAGVTQAELATRIGASAVYITNLEAGRTNLTIGQIANIADALGASVNLELPLLVREPTVIH